MCGLKSSQAQSNDETNGARWSSEPFQPVLRQGRLDDDAPVVDWNALPEIIPGEWRLYAAMRTTNSA